MQFGNVICELTQFQHWNIVDDETGVWGVDTVKGGLQFSSKKSVSTCIGVRCC